MSFNQDLPYAYFKTNKTISQLYKCINTKVISLLNHCLNVSTQWLYCNGFSSMCSVITTPLSQYFIYKTFYFNSIRNPFFEKHTALIIVLIYFLSMYIIKCFYKSNNTKSHAKTIVHLLHSYDLSPNAKIDYINRLYTHFN